MGDKGGRRAARGRGLPKRGGGVPFAFDHIRAGSATRFATLIRNSSKLADCRGSGYLKRKFLTK
jgi:hypothetical protein